MGYYLARCDTARLYCAMLVTTHPQLSERVCIGYVLLLKSQLRLDIQVETPPGPPTHSCASKAFEFWNSGVMNREVTEGSQKTLRTSDIVE